MKVDIKKMSVEEREQLQAQLDKETKAEQALRSKKRKSYEKNKETRIKKIVAGANKLTDQLLDYKQSVFAMMEEQHKELDEFGGIPTKSKGGFSIETKDGMYKVIRSRATTPKYDELSHKGLEMIHEFLESKLSAADKDSKVFIEMLIDLASRNKKAELDYQEVMTLFTYQDKFNDPQWVEGHRLLREGYSVEFKKWQYTIQKKNDQGKFETLPLNFSAV